MNLPPPPDAKINQYLRQVAAQHKPQPMPITPQRRRLTGMLAGAAAGTLLSVTILLVNPIALARLPLYISPSALLEIGIGFLSGALAGLITNWTSELQRGVGLGALTAAIIWTLLSALYDRMQGLPNATAEVDLLCQGIGLLFITVLLLPVALLLRWATEVYNEQPGLPFYHWRRSRLLLATGGIAILAGTMTLYPTPVRNALAYMNEYLSEGLAAQTTGELPRPLNGENMHHFRQYATPRYTLAWEDSRHAIYRVGTPPIPIVVRFDNGYRLVCVFKEDYPTCKEYLPESSLSTVTR